MNVAWAYISRRASTLMYICIAVLSAFMFCFIAINGNDTNLGPNLADIPGAAARTAYSFFMGIIIFHLKNAIKIRITISAWAILLFAAFVIFYRPANNLVLLYELTVIIIVSPLIVVFGSFVEPDQKSSKIYSVLGDISFPLYVIHQPLIAMFVFIQKRYDLNHFSVGVAFLLIAILAAFLAHKGDVRFRTWISARIPAR